MAANASNLVFASYHYFNRRASVNNDTTDTASHLPEKPLTAIIYVITHLLLFNADSCQDADSL